MLLDCFSAPLTTAHADGAECVPSSTTVQPAKSPSWKSSRSNSVEVGVGVGVGVAVADTGEKYAVPRAMTSTMPSFLYRSWSGLGIDFFLEPSRRRRGPVSVKPIYTPVRARMSINPDQRRRGACKQ